MDFITRTDTHPLFARLRSWKPPLPRNFESRRRLRASLMMGIAVTAGILSSHSIEKQTIASYRQQTRPTLGQIVPWMRQMGWRQIDPTHAAFSPPLESPGSWWVEKAQRRIWYVESRTEAHLFEGPTAQSLKKSTTPQFHLAGTGWEAIPALFSVLARAAEPSSQLRPRAGRAPQRHSKEWQF